MYKAKLWFHHAITMKKLTKKYSFCSTPRYDHFGNHGVKKHKIGQRAAKVGLKIEAHQQQYFLN